MSVQDPNKIIKLLLERNITSIRLNWDSLRKELNSSSSAEDAFAQSKKEWAAFVLKRERERNAANSTSTSHIVPKEESQERRSLLEVIERELTTLVLDSEQDQGKTGAEEIQKLAEVWISRRPSSTVENFDPLDVAERVDELLIGTTQDTDDALRSLASLRGEIFKATPYALKKESYEYLLHFNASATPDAGLNGSVPPPRKLDLQISSLNESLQKRGSSINKSLETDIKEAWHPARSTLRALLEFENSEKKLIGSGLVSLLTAHEKKHALDLRPFEEFWKAKTERFKKKNGKKNGTQPEDDPDEVDLIFNQYIESVERAANAHFTEVLEATLEAFLGSVKTYQMELRTALAACGGIDEDERFVEILVKNAQAQIDKWKLQEAEDRRKVECDLDDLRTTYLEGSNKTVTGRLERVSNRDFKKRITELETRLVRNRRDNERSLGKVFERRPFDLVGRRVLICCLRTGQIREAEALELHAKNLASDSTSQTLFNERRKLDQLYRMGLKTGQIELGKRIACILLNEGERAIQDYEWKKSNIVKTAARAKKAVAVAVIATPNVDAATAAGPAAATNTSTETKPKNKKKKKKKDKDKDKDGNEKAVDETSGDTESTPPLVSSSSSIGTILELEINGSKFEIDEEAEERSSHADTVVPENQPKGEEDNRSIRALNERSAQANAVVTEDSSKEKDNSSATAGTAEADVKIPTSHPALPVTGAQAASLFAYGPPGFMRSVGMPSYGGAMPTPPFFAAAAPFHYPLGPPFAYVPNPVSPPDSPRDLELHELREENKRLRADNSSLRGENAKLGQQLKRQVEELRKQSSSRFDKNGNGFGASRGSRVNWNRKTQMRCANCLELGHESKDCTAPCRECDEVGHLPEVCPKRGTHGV